MRESAFRMKEATKASTVENPETGQPSFGVGQGCRVELTSKAVETCLLTGTSYTWEGSVGNEPLEGLGSSKMAWEKKTTVTIPKKIPKSASAQQRWPQNICLP